MSFSAGFRDGFDLVNDVKDREVAQRRLDEQARQGDLDRETQTQRYNLDREATADYRQGQLDNTAEGNRIQGVTAEAKLLEAKNRETQLGQDEILNTSRAGLADSQAAANSLKTDTEVERLSNIKMEEGFARNAQAYLDHIQTGKSATARTPEWTATADELFKATKGGITSPWSAVDPETQANGEAFESAMTAMQNGEDASRETLTPIINTFVRSSNMREIGTELTKQNTPSAGHLNGKGFKIIGKEVAPDWQVVDGILTGTVDVTVQNAAGQVTVYNAPLTSGRSGVERDDKGNPVVDANGVAAPPVPLGIATEDLMTAASGYFKYAQYIGQFEDEIYQSATRLYDARNGTGSLEGKSNAYITNFQTKYAVGTLAGEASPIKGLTNAELASPQHFNKLERYAQYSVLDPSKNSIKPTNAAEQVINQTVALDEVKALEGEVNAKLGRGLTRSEILHAQGYFSLDKNDQKVISREDKRAWELWKNKVLERVKTERPQNIRHVTVGGLPD